MSHVLPQLLRRRVETALRKRLAAHRARRFLGGEGLTPEHFVPLRLGRLALFDSYVRQGQRGLAFLEFCFRLGQRGLAFLDRLEVRFRLAAPQPHGYRK